MITAVLSVRIPATHGHCRGFEMVQIERGHVGNIDLGGLCDVVLYAWPGPIFVGGGCRCSLTNAPDAGCHPPAASSSIAPRSAVPYSQSRRRHHSPGAGKSYGQYNRLRHSGAGVVRG
ncbi:MAG: DUF1326 domain-containing protein [Gammaproteobacteria bacterium]|nr:DUF1326 domain-containing protein [Gammaproteobacteria bacterium]